ncbi:MAG: peptide deformylase [Clostridia bacterium]|nr:peptide deformylase [Clostridia bacterium]
MVRPIVHDPLLLGMKSDPAAEADSQVMTDLLDTLRAHLDHCVGMAANMIGVRKRIIVFCNGPFQMIMVNPQIIAKSGPFEAEEGCLSLPGVRKARRFRRITVRYQDMSLRQQTGTFDGFTAQIIQHEIDHCDGILI